MAEDREKSEGKGFKVADRRRFSETGEARETAPTEERSESAVESRSDQRRAEAPEESERSPVEINFSTFVISLSTQALMHLGEIPDPITGKVETELAVAKQMIDIIALLGEKSRGNLDPGEQQLMEDVLYDLRMKYVEAVKKK
jgi:Domain of unknown function (DUF1844)